MRFNTRFCRHASLVRLAWTVSKADTGQFGTLGLTYIDVHIPLDHRTDQCGQQRMQASPVTD